LLTNDNRFFDIASIVRSSFLLIHFNPYTMGDGHFDLLNDLFFLHPLPREYRFSAGTRDLLVTILCQALDVPRDCTRDLRANEKHRLVPFTNHRTIQVYCYHTADEWDILHEFLTIHNQWDAYHRDNLFADQRYEQATERVFWRSRPLLAWEGIFPDGFDMEALSPRDANARMRGKQQAQQKTKNPIAKLTGKEKDHPPPPPAEVYEPKSSDRPNGATYQTGKLLGKGGFAICYEGQLAGTRRKYALKIVKSSMAQKKMEQKVVARPPKLPNTL